MDYCELGLVLGLEAFGGKFVLVCKCWVLLIGQKLGDLAVNFGLFRGDYFKDWILWGMITSSCLRFAKFYIFTAFELFLL